MINPFEFVDAISDVGIDFVVGVPDSLLKEVCACITAKLPPENHIIANNEGSAIGLAIGHYLATRKPALVYMQNSGLGNAINPIASLADPLVYGIPIVLLIGWRGELIENDAQLKDEPQHAKQGRITLQLLDAMDIPYVLIDQHSKEVHSVLGRAREMAVKRSGPVAIVVRKNSFRAGSQEIRADQPYELGREDAILQIVDIIPEDIPIVSTTGMASRELFEIRKRGDSGHHRDFLTVGGMGHASQIAVGIAMATPKRRVLCLDGDGALLMHAGGLAISADCHNLVHVLLNNEAHDSVGGQPTKGGAVGFAEVARSFGYRFASTALVAQDIRDWIRFVLASEGSAFLEIKCRRGSRHDLGRPNRTPAENKTDFMSFIGHDHD